MTNEELNDAINSLPDPIRRYVHALETQTGPVADVRRAWLAEERVKELTALLGQPTE